MGEVIDLATYRFYKLLKAKLIHDGIKCKFSYKDPTFVAALAQLTVGNTSFPEFFTSMASYAMQIDSISPKKGFLPAWHRMRCKLIAFLLRKTETCLL